MISCRFLIILLLSLSPLTFGSSVTIDHIDGSIGPDKIGYGQPIKFHIRFTNTSLNIISGSTNGFRFYSIDNAQWEPITITLTGNVTEAMYINGLFTNSFSITGFGADTVAINGYALPPSSGIPAGFDNIVATFNTQVNSSFNGKHLCLDTSFFPPGGAWIWSLEGSVEIYPTWSGPYCYEITSPTVGISENSSFDLPDKFVLYQNFPNPFNSSTFIDFFLPYKGSFKILIYNALGQEVKSIAGQGNPGNNRIEIDMNEMASGIYFYRFKNNVFSDVKKMILIK